MLIALALSLLATTAPADTARGTIRGAVQSDASGVPLALALVEVGEGGATLTATTDSAGAYVIRRVPAGMRTLRVHHIGHDELEMKVLVPAGGDVELDVSLKAHPVPLAVITADGASGGGVGDTAQAGRGAMAMVDQKMLNEGPGAGAAAPPPGAGSAGGAGDPSDPRDVLWVRGSAADLKLVLLDGAPVYTPFHMGGLIQTFEPEALGAARLYLGGAPARYDGGLAYVMELDTRAGRPERMRATGGADLVSGRVLAEGPLPGGATYLANFRAVNGGLLKSTGGEPFPYEYSEGLARFDLPGRTGGASLTLFANDEGVRVDTVAIGDDFARWGNLAASLRWHGVVSEGLHLETTAAFSDFRARLPYSTDIRSVVMLGDTRRLRLAADFTRAYSAATFRYGVSYDRTWVGNDVWTRLPTRARLFDERNAGDVGGLYGDVAWQPAHTVAVRGGLRADLFGTGQVASLSPRLSATWLLGPRAALTLAGGRYHQYVRVARQDGTGTPATLPDSLHLATRLAVARATHVSLALDQELPRTLRLGLEGYFKHYERVAGPGDESYVSGVDVWVRRGAGAVTGWVGYSLTWAWALDTSGTWGTDRFDGRQVITSGVAGPLGRAGRFEVRLAYGSGLPYAAIPSSVADGTSGDVASPGDLNSGGPAEQPSLSQTPREPYLRLDAEVRHTFSPAVLGRRLELTPYVRLLNALDHRDGLFYRYQGSDNTLRSLGALPFLPIAGLTFRT